MAKISKKTIESLREFLDRGCDYAGTQETVTEIANEALRENGCELCQCDDASVCDWDGDEVCTVEDFAFQRVAGNVRRERRREPLVLH